MKLTSAQMNALRYAARGEVRLEVNGAWCAVGKRTPVTDAAMALLKFGLVEEDDESGWVLVLTDAGRAVPAGEEP